MSGDEAVVSGIDGGMDINCDGAYHPYLKLIVKSPAPLFVSSWT